MEKGVDRRRLLLAYGSSSGILIKIYFGYFLSRLQPLPSFFAPAANSIYAYLHGFYKPFNFMAYVLVQHMLPERANASADMEVAP